MTQHKFNTIPLDPDILATPFKVQTNWQVLTGAACSGKTTLIDMLATRGYQTAPETARLYIDQELAKGRPIERIIRHKTTEPAIEAMQLALERALPDKDLVFLDRALPDSVIFRRISGLDFNEVLVECFHHRYASVFILEQLPLRLDGARVDDDLYRDHLDHWLERDYRALGYQPVRVPVLPPEARLAYILDRLP